MRRTRIIAHRGASGHLPEHTLPAKCLAYGMGVDFLEQDLVASRDGRLVVLHDLHLNDVSDVATRFPGRSRSDGRHYVADFDLTELRELRLCERRAAGRMTPRFPGRFSAEIDGLRIVTLDEELELVASLNRTTGRAVGVYPEIKAPEWHTEQGIDITALTVRCLARCGYAAPDANAYLQSFSRAALVRAGGELGCRTPRVLLLDGEAVAGIDGDGWESVTADAVGVGLPFELLLEADAGGEPMPGPLVARLRAAGLEIHPYTLRRDEPAGGRFDFEAALDCLINRVGVEALFCDQPDVALAVRAGGAIG